MQKDAEWEVALSALAEEIRARMETPRSEYVDLDRAFSAARSTVETARATRPGSRHVEIGTDPLEST